MKISPSFLFRGRNRRCFAPGTAERLPATRAGGLTPLFDTVVLASEYLLQHGDAKAEKILIVFSDGADTISRSSLANAVDAALMNDVRVFWIDLNSSLSQGAGVLYRMADATGGRYFSARDGVGRALNIILEGFRATYTVSYRLTESCFWISYRAGSSHTQLGAAASQSKRALLSKSCSLNHVW